MFENNDVIVFQGDSVTDGGRMREVGDDLGRNYPFFLAAWLAAAAPQRTPRFLNRGISGNRVQDLQSRWQHDVLDLHPTWVSLLIGINDTWRRYDSHDPTTVEQFAAGYRDLLVQTIAAKIEHIIICEPFLLPVTSEQWQWREDLDPKIQAIRQLGQEFRTLYVPLDGIFAQAATHRPPNFWVPDGVHPSPAGHALIAQSWLQTFTATSS